MNEVTEPKKKRKRKEYVTVQVDSDISVTFLKPAPLSERVRAYILEESGSLAEIARKTGIPKTTLNPWLLGKKSVTTNVLDRICEVYLISPIRLFDKSPSDDIPSLQELSEFKEGEKPAMVAAIYEAKERAGRAQYDLLTKIARDIEREAEAMRVDAMLDQEREGEKVIMKSFARPRKESDE